MAKNNPMVKKNDGGTTTSEPTRGGFYYTPPVDIYETNDEVVILCDMPGVKPADVDVKFENGELTLYGKISPRPTSDQWLAEEYGIGNFYRTFIIAPEIDADKISAEGRDGVLAVHLPKQEKVKPRKITVNG